MNRRKGKLVPDADSRPDPPNAGSATSAISFTHWREMLNQVPLPVPQRQTYERAIEAFLDYCRLKGLSVLVETARGFVSDALRRGLAQDESAWKAALNWYFREGHRRSAPTPPGVPLPGQADTGKTPWERRLIELLRLRLRLFQRVAGLETRDTALATGRRLIPRRTTVRPRRRSRRAASRRAGIGL